MLDRQKLLQILVESNRRSLKDIEWAMESLESGTQERTNYSKLRRAFHTIKHDSSHLKLERLARLAAGSEAIIQRATDNKLGLPVDLLRKAATEIRVATETVAAGGRHKLDPKLLREVEAQAKTDRVG